MQNYLVFHKFTTVAPFTRVAKHPVVPVLNVTELPTSMLIVDAFCGNEKWLNNLLSINAVEHDSGETNISWAVDKFLNLV